jgi:hypothetical protein
MHEEEKRRPRPFLTLVDDPEFRQAQELLKDPDQIAPVDQPSFGKRLAEILMRGKSSHDSKSQRSNDDD